MRKPPPAITIESPVAVLNAALPMLSLSATVELAWLLQGARQLIRLTCREQQLIALLRGLASHGIAGHACEGRLIPVIHAGLGGYGMGGVITDKADVPGALAIVFLARDAAAAWAGSRLQTAGDDASIGAALGYPACCVDRFKQNRAEYATGFAPLFSAGCGPWPWWSNALLAPFGWLPVSHLPCAPECAATGARAAEYRSALERFDAPFAAFMRLRLASLVMWHPLLGIAVKPQNEPWTASGGLRPYVRSGAIMLDESLAEQCHWTDHGKPI
jgi:hypothetical protein